MPAALSLICQPRHVTNSGTEKLKIARPVVPAIRRNKASFLKPTLRVRARQLRSEGMLRHGSLTALL